MGERVRRILVAGARGLLGTPTCRVFRSDPEVQVEAVDLPELDITDAYQVAAKCDAFRPEVVVNCAAYTAVDACEENEPLATRVNGDGAGFLAIAAEQCGARFIHISTDYVFEGDASEPYAEDDPPGRPERLSAYGRSKLLGEELVQAHHPAAVIVRTAWLYGPDGRGFPNAILRRAHEERHRLEHRLEAGATRAGATLAGGLRVVNDQTGSPTYAPDLATALFELARRTVSGIFHVTNSGQCTWYEFAGELIRLAGLDVPITPVTTEEFPRPARRPAFSVLSNRRYVEAVGLPLRHWREAAGEYIGRMKEEG